MSEPYYSDESVTLFHGDCLEVDEWLAADVLVTDPPYGIDYRSHTMYRSPRLRGQARVDRSSIASDDDASVRDATLARWGSGPAAIFGSWRIPRPLGTRHRLIWHKQGRTPGPVTAPFYPVDEEIYIIGSWHTSPPVPNVMTTREARHLEPGRWGHPTPKPVQLMERLITKCPPGVIADPFAGSGSTLVAARNLGRRAIGVELEERYCEIIARRLSQGVLL